MRSLTLTLAAVFVLALSLSIQAAEGQYSPDASAASLPADVAEFVWSKIDDNGDGRATDKEAYAAVKPIRVQANAKEPNELQAALKKAANKDSVAIVSEEEALGVIAIVRGQRCPTAKAAKSYFDRLDSNNNGTLEGLEMQNAMRPLGDVGRVLFQPVGSLVKSMDLNDNNLIETDELYLSANAMGRVQLATEGTNIARRKPADWVNFVKAVSFLDVNADNVLSPQEALQVKAVGLQFSNIDRNRDQKVTVSELCDYQAQLDIAAALRSASSGGFS